MEYFNSRKDVSIPHRIFQFQFSFRHPYLNDIGIDDSTFFAISEGVWYNHKMVKIDLSLGEVGSGAFVALKCFGRRWPGEYP